MSTDEPLLVERTIGDWTSYQDDEGRTYYYNSVTEESSWDTPPGFEDADNTAEQDAELLQTPDDDDDDGITKSPALDGDDDGISQSPAALEDQRGEDDDDLGDGEEIGEGWIAYKDDEGRTYYYNSVSEETQWERPDIQTNISKPNDNAKRDDEGDYIMDASPTASDREDEAEAETETKETADDNTTTAQEEKDDPVTKAENFLKEPDAILESQVFDHISTLVTEMGPQAGGKVMYSLMNGYQGETAICGLMGLWLAELKASSASFGKSTAASAAGEEENQKKRFDQGADAARDVVEQVVNRLAKEKFTKDGGDDIMKLSKSEVAFLDAMIDSERWRNLLVSNIICFTIEVGSMLYSQVLNVSLFRLIFQQPTKTQSFSCTVCNRYQTRDTIEQ